MPPLEEPEMEEGKTGEGTVLSAVPREGDGKVGRPEATTMCRTAHAVATNPWNTPASLCALGNVV